MTITYQFRVANTTLGGFVKLLGMWKGSVYKLVYKEMIIFAVLYAAISLVYRLGLNEQQRVYDLVFLASKTISQEPNKYLKTVQWYKNTIKMKT